MTMTLCKSHGHTENRKMHEEKEMKEAPTNTKRNHLQLSRYPVIQYPRNMRELLKC